METGDTLLLTRTLGDIWIGFDIGSNIDVFFGALKIPIHPNDPVDESNPIISYKTGSGIGAFGGLVGEYMPPGGALGGFFQIHLLDYKPGSASTDPYPGDSLKRTYKALFDNFYLNLTPGIIYNFGIPYLNFTCGLDFDFLIYQKNQVSSFFVNTGDISYISSMTSKPNPFRMGFNVGMSYDIYVADINNAVRAFLSPYVSFNGGSNVFSDFGSSRSMFLFRFGVSIKASLDRTIGNAIRYNPDVENTPTTFVEQETERPIRFEGIIKSTPKFSGDISSRIQPGINQEIGETPQVSGGEQVRNEANSVPETPKINYTVGQIKRFSYSRSDITGLTKEIEQFLDGIAEILKENPRATVRVRGYSDNQGNPDQIVQRSKDRAEKVFNYLRKKGINENRIKWDGFGDLYSIAKNDTEAGRRKNRRVEIQVVQQ